MGLVTGSSQKGLHLSPQGYGAVSRTIAGTTLTSQAAWVWACDLKTVLYHLGLHQGCIVSYLDPKPPTKALLSMDGCQIIVQEYEKRMVYSIILLISLFPSSL